MEMCFTRFGRKSNASLSADYCNPNSLLASMSAAGNFMHIKTASAPDRHPVIYVAHDGDRINHKLFIESKLHRGKSLRGVDTDVEHGWKLKLSSMMQLRLLRHDQPSECSSRLIKIQFQREGCSKALQV